MNFIFILIIFIGVLACCLYLYIIYSFLITSQCGKYPPYFPSFGKMKKIALDEADKILSPEQHPQNIMDLGCGSGGMLIPLAKRYPQHHFIGYEWSNLALMLARFHTKKHTNITIIRGDFMQADLSKQNLILCFGGNEIAQELSQKLLHELPQDSFIVSSAFRMHGFTKSKEVAAKTYGFMPIKVFVYQQSKP